MNKEIGGYLELDNFSMPMKYENGIKLNCGRNALAYLIEANQINKIWLPYFICDSVVNVCKKYNVQIERYHINKYFNPLIDIKCKNEWIYIVNYYGQLSENQIIELTHNYQNIIIDNAQAYFISPFPGTHTIYTCRKFFGVSDGGILFTNKHLDRKIDSDYSYERIKFVLGRYEKKASNFFQLSSLNNDMFDNEDIKYMSRLTENLLHAIDYDAIELKRTKNYLYLYSKLEEYNYLKLKKVKGAYMYPLYIDNSQKIKQMLINKKIYIPTLWPNVLEELDDNYLEYKFAMNILPLPCDQRYDIGDMKRIIKIIKESI